VQLRGASLSAGSFNLGPIDLDIGKGEYFVLMGPTGSGKSLMIKSICGLVRLRAGQVLLEGRDVTDLPARKRRIGYVPQDSGLFPHLSVERNIAFPLKLADRRSAPRKKQILPVAASLGIEYLLGRRTPTLSGGERQKVALARALVARPKLLVLDEPVSALDEPTRRETCELLLRIQREYKLTTLHICHSRTEAQQVADRVGVLSEGKLAQVGTLEQIANEPADAAVARLLNV
jgi:ABC-type sugar transport system ATPase subunit